MRLLLSAVAVLALAAPVFAQPKDPKLPNLPPNLMAPTDPLSPEDQRKQFVVPAGFEVQLVASEPDIQKPMQMAFDAKGRLWVTTSYHYPFPVDNAKATDKVFILSDFDPETGKARKVQTFISDLNIPIGILPLPDCNSCIVSSIGEIRKYTDTDGDGKADKKEVLFTGFGWEDTHGMYNSYTLMPDGWVYACHGFKNTSKVKGKDGHVVEMNSGNTFRFKIDGSRIEVYTRGQVNPFGMAVDPWFNLYTADCHSKPITQLIPGAYYESFGKPHDGLGFAQHVTAHPHKSTGLCGLTWYDADHFPKEYLNHMFLGDVVSNCVSLDKIVWKGATPVAVEQPDFLTSKDRWFRPVDIKLGPDGALYVADFYNKIIGHYEVNLKDPRRDKDRGRLWRIVWKGKDGKAPAPKFPRADWTKASLEELLTDAKGSPNATVRALATQQALVQMQAKSGGTPEATVLAFLTVLSDPKNPAEVPEDSFEFRRRMLAVRVFAAWKEWTDRERKEAVEGLASKSAKLQRAWVEAVGFHPHADFAAPLLDILAKLPADDANTRQAAKIALRNCLQADPGQVLKLGADEKTDVILSEVLLGVRTEEGAKMLAAIVKVRELPAPMMNAAAEFIGRYGDPQARDLLLSRVSHWPKDKAERTAELLLLLFRGVQAKGAKLDADEAAKMAGFVSWAVEAVRSDLGTATKMGAAEFARLRAALRVLNALPTVVNWKDVPEGTKKTLALVLTQTSEGKNMTDDARAACVESFLILDPREGYKQFKKLLDDANSTPELREQLYSVAARSLVTDAILDARDAMKDVPYRTAIQIGISLASTRTGAEVLLAAVKQGKAPARLLQEKVILERLRASGLPGWEQQVNDLTKNLPPLDQKIAETIRKRAAGFASAKVDKELGAKLFVKHCGACHRIGDQGGKIAPQLDSIGLRGTERLLEDVLDPNRNVDAAFRARVIKTTDDRTITGLMLKVDGEVLVLADHEGKEIRLPLKDIATNRETLLSAMPANFIDTIPEADLYNLLAYLLDQKAKEPPKKKE